MWYDLSKDINRIREDRVTQYVKRNWGKLYKNLKKCCSVNSGKPKICLILSVFLNIICSNKPTLIRLEDPRNL